jgi:hypothetical protein
MSGLKTREESDPRKEKDLAVPFTEQICFDAGEDAGAP